MLVNLKAMPSASFAIAPQVSDSDLEKLSSDNPEAKFETDSKGHLIIMSPQNGRSDRRLATTGDANASRGSNSGKFNLTLAAQIWLWNSQTNLGVTFDSSTGFKLSNNAVRSPDVTWIRLERWNELTPQQQDKYAPQRERADRRLRRLTNQRFVHPDFVIELKSLTDDWQELQAKMIEYMDCPKGYRFAYGVKLGWLINPEDKLVEIYRQGRNKEVFNNPQALSGKDILPGLTVDLTEIF